MENIRHVMSGDAPPRKSLVVTAVSLCVSPLIYHIYYMRCKGTRSTFITRPLSTLTYAFLVCFLLLYFKSDILMSVFPPPTSPGVLFIATEHIFD